MARTTRSSVLLWLQEAFGMQSGTDQVPVDVAKEIQPVIEVGPRRTTFLKTLVSSATSTGATIFTTDIKNETYITFVCLSATKDVACDNVAVSLSAVVDGLNTRIAHIEWQTLTARDQVIALSFPHPIRLDKNSIVTLIGAFTVGTMNKRVTVGGFVLE